MKKSNIATLVVFLLLIPATLYLGTKLPGRSYYITGTLIIIELMLPFFMTFEGRRPQARELVLIAVMCALAIAGRVAIPIPNFKAVFAIIMISGIAFGPETGFMVGAIAAFGSNFFYSQGAYTPWQMFSFGVGGMLAGFAFAKGRLPRKAWLMAAFGFAAVVLIVGPIMDSMSLFLGFAKLNKDVFRIVFLPGLAMNVTQGLCTAAVMLVFGKPLLAILDRIRIKYGLQQKPSVNMQAAIFDMDGTLIDSLIFWEYLWRDLGKRFLDDESFRPTEADDKAVRTLTMKDAMALIHDRYKIGPDPEALWKYTEDLLLDFYKTKVQLKPGAREFLDACYQSGTKMCIASASAPALVEVALKHCGIKKYFPKVFSCADLGFGKERPDVYLMAQEFMGMPIEETWVFEDSLAAIETAAKAGFPTVGIYDRNNYGQEQIKAIATRYIAPGENLTALL